MKSTNASALPGSRNLNPASLSHETESWTRKPRPGLLGPKAFVAPR